MDFLCNGLQTRVRPQSPNEGLTMPVHHPTRRRVLQTGLVTTATAGLAATAPALAAPPCGPGPVERPDPGTAREPVTARPPAGGPAGAGAPTPSALSAGPPFTSPVTSPETGELLFSGRSPTSP